MGILPASTQPATDSGIKVLEQLSEWKLMLSFNSARY